MRTIVLTDITDVIARRGVVVMTIDEFIDTAMCSGLIDDDGSGYLMINDHVETDIDFSPSQVAHDMLVDPKFTHVAWYNR